VGGGGSCFSRLDVCLRWAGEGERTRGRLLKNTHIQTHAPSNAEREPGVSGSEDDGSGDGSDDYDSEETGELETEEEEEEGEGPPEAKAAPEAEGAEGEKKEN
jgi:hypothetical protein